MESCFQQSVSRGLKECAVWHGDMGIGNHSRTEQLPLRDVSVSASARGLPWTVGNYGRPDMGEAEALRLACRFVLPSRIFWGGFGPLVFATGGIVSSSGREVGEEDTAQQVGLQRDAASSERPETVSGGNEEDSSPSSSEETDGRVCEEAAVSSPGESERTSLAIGIELPEDLKKSVTVLSCESTAPSGKAVVYILGTAHVSTESVAQVRKLVQLVRPQSVFVELCHERLIMLAPPPTDKQKIPTFSEMVANIREKPGNAFGIVYGCLLAKVSEKMDVQPGEEFRAAYEEAMTLGADVTLGDRPVQVTIKRTWARLSLWHRVKLIGGLLLQSAFLPSKEELQLLVEELKGTDMLTAAVKDMSKQFPTLYETLVTERDKYMAATLHSVAEHSNAVVAVVGKGHQEGMAKYWGTHIDIQSLLHIPPPVKKSLWSSRRTWGIIGVLAGCTAIVVMRSRHLSK